MRLPRQALREAESRCTVEVMGKDCGTHALAVTRSAAAIVLHAYSTGPLIDTSGEEESNRTRRPERPMAATRCCLPRLGSADPAAAANARQVAR